MTQPFNQITMPVLLEAIAGALGLTRQDFEGRCAALDARLNALEARTAPQELIERIAALEQRTSEWRYRGVWQHGEQYEIGNFVTERGELWHCNARTKTRPTDGTGAWTMCVKAGKNGRDARKPHPQA